MSLLKNDLRSSIELEMSAQELRKVLGDEREKARLETAERDELSRAAEGFSEVVSWIAHAIVAQPCDADSYAHIVKVIDQARAKLLRARACTDQRARKEERELL